MKVIDDALRTLSFKWDYPLIAPTTVMFNVIRRCNAGCKYCGDWMNDPDPRTDPSLSSIIDILSDLRSLGVRWVTFSGGEPLLRRDIYDLMQEAVTMGLAVSIITNGTALTESGAHRMARMGIAKLGISIDSLDPSRLMSTRGLKVDSVLKSINLVSQLKARQYPSLNVSLYVTVTRINIDDLLPMVDFAIERGIKIQFQPVAYAASGATEQVLDRLWPTPEEIKKLSDITNELVARKLRGDPIINRPEFLAQIPGYFQNKTFYPGNQCTVAYTDIVIDTNFGVRPCWSMEPIAYLGEGKDSIRQVWYSHAMKQARKIIREKKCPGCLYACHINKSYLQLPSLNDALSNTRTS